MRRTLFLWLIGLIALASMPVRVSTQGGQLSDHADRTG
jgi:hypothetical protein